MSARRSGRAKARRRKAVMRRNPLVAPTRERGQGIEASAKGYRRHGKHKKPPSDDGGFALLPVTGGCQSVALVLT